jgi:hypothetical protein
MAAFDMIPRETFFNDENPRRVMAAASSAA